MSPNSKKIVNCLQVIQSASEIMYKELPAHRRKKYLPFLQTIEDRIHYISTSFDGELQI